MINVHRVSVGKRVLMIGSGNVGLIVTYQLLQAGIDVAGIVEAAPQLGGYGVHAGKVRRAGVPLYVGHTVIEAVPNEDMSGVKGAIIAEVDNKFQPIPGTEQFVECDVIGIAVGLTPDIALPSMADVTLINAGRLGSQVPMHDRNMETTKEGIYVAGDSSGGHTAFFSQLMREDGNVNIYLRETADMNIYPDVDASVKGIISLYGALSVMLEDGMPSTLNHHQPDSPEGMEMGGTDLRNNPELCSKMSVECNISENVLLPPVLMFHGTKDRTINPKVSVVVYEALKKYNKDIF